MVSDNKANDSPEKGESSSQSMWGGRFEGGPDAVMRSINASIDVDRHLYRQDIAGSRAHAHMLVACGILSQTDGDAIQAGLDTIEGEITRGEIVFDPALEDIHMHIEKRLTELAGDAGARLHTARSRNDQVATDFRLWVRDRLDAFEALITRYVAALCDQAAQHTGTIMPGFTHLQTAQPVTLGHHLMAYAFMALRDRGRLQDCRARLNECPLGAAALAGTPFPIDRQMTAKALGFDAPMANSLDAVSARDFAIEYLNALSLTAIHLSRLAEEIILWASAPFGFITLSDRFSTGSSIMPQKRNPDAAELVRAKAAGLQAAATGLAGVMKGLPLAYAKDMQEDKAATLRASADFELCLQAMLGMVEDLAPNPEAMLAAAAGGFSTATDLADWLVRELGLPFRRAHHVTGAAVKLAEQKGVGLNELALSDLQAIEAGITQGVYGVLSVEASVASRQSEGGTAPEAVSKAIARARAAL